VKKKIRKEWFGAMMLALGFMACAGIESTPAWVSGELPAEYARKRFVSALGTGEDLSAARATAKGELSRIFSARLDSELLLSENETVLDGRSSQSSTLLGTTKITTALELQAAEVPLHWEDPKTGTFWALAVLEREAECRRIGVEARDLITRVDGEVDAAGVAANPLAALRAALGAARLGGALDELQARGRVLGRVCLPPRSQATGTLRRAADDRMRSLAFSVRGSEVDPANGEAIGTLPQLREEIASNLSRLGFQVGPISGAESVTVDARLRLLPVTRGTEWVEFRFEGSAEIASVRPQEPTLIVVEAEGTESHPEPSSARLRARRAGEQALAAALDRRLKSYLGEGTED